MRYLIEPKDGIYIKGYGFLSFAENMGKKLSSKYGQKFLCNAKKLTTDAIKTASKRAIQKTAETTGDLIGNEIADKITSVSKKSKKKKHKIMKLMVNQEHQKKDAYLQKKYNKSLMN